MQGKLLMVKIITKTKLSVLNFDGCQYDHCVYKVSDISMGFVKSYSHTHLILLQMS